VEIEVVQRIWPLTKRAAFSVVLLFFALEGRVLADDAIERKIRMLKDIAESGYDGELQKRTVERLLTALNPRLRLHAAIAHRRIGGDAEVHVAVLESLMTRSQRREVCNRAAEELAHSGREGIRVLEAKLRHTGRERSVALFGLSRAPQGILEGRTVGGAVRSVLSTGENDSDVVLCLQIVRNHQRLIPYCVDEVVRLLSSERHAFRAAKALSSVGALDTRHLNEIRGALLHMSDLQAVEYASRILARLGETTVAELLRITADVKNEGRAAAINRGFKHVVGDEFVPVLIKLSRADSPRTRRWSLMGLEGATTYVGDALAASITKLEDDDDQVRAAAAFAAEEIVRRAEALPRAPLMSTLAASEDENVRRAAVNCFAAFAGHPAAKEVFLAALGDKDVDVRVAALVGLVRCPQPIGESAEPLLVIVQRRELLHLSIPAFVRVAAPRGEHSRALRSMLRGESRLAKRVTACALAARADLARVVLDELRALSNCPDVRVRLGAALAEAKAVQDFFRVYQVVTSCLERYYECEAVDALFLVQVLRRLGEAAVIFKRAVDDVLLQGKLFRDDGRVRALRGYRRELARIVHER